ncbi:nuclear transport factor 2 family protein [Mycobacterium sp.]|uniref:nuclear transport factor 2 family protein n=1 Tax=Mycobacterium sp. TaxID=1785 RepID=UPI002C230607|nr:nuclear transport factor 2 family protein [Mycobacterium sp.]HTY35211.1 nuclear transport factor 2 family protein [Mycobacterium sp.]
MAALVVMAVARLPVSVRRRVLRAAFERARDAFNRGDLEAVFGLFAKDVEYGPPPPLHTGGALLGRRAVFDFWRAVFDRYDENTIENLSLDEVAPWSFVRRARLRHRTKATGASLDYVVVQTTHLRGGRVVRQVNVLERPPGNTRMA